MDKNLLLVPASLSKYDLLEKQQNKIQNLANQQ